VDLSRAHGYDLIVDDLPGRGRGYAVSRYRVDEQHDLTLVDQSVQYGGAVRVSATLPAPAVELVVIKPLRGRDHRGPHRGGEPEH
jgi:xylan 1,4-beta-xylosidase